MAAAAWWAKYCGFSDILAFDMGGTTAKLCAVMGGVAPTTDEYEVARIHHSKKGSGLQVNVPVLDLLEIGTGGGSIAHVDRLKLLKVGPRSSGAVPGPACYGRGGTNFTVTDADLLLGYLGADCFLGGSMRLDAEAAREAASQLDLGMTPIQLACGVHDIANEDMVVAARLHLAERGLAGESLALVAFGGAGPVHAWGIARSGSFHCHRAAGCRGDVGPGHADRQYRDRSRAGTWPTARGSSLDAVGKALVELEEEATALLPKIEGGELSFSRTGTFRYAGQGFSISVQLPLRDEWHDVTAEALIERFGEAYEKMYARRHDDVATELVDLRVVAELKPRNQFSPSFLEKRTNGAVADDQGGEREVYFSGNGFLMVPIYNRYLLKADDVIEGPAIVEERETTTIVGPGSSLKVDRYGSLVITL